MLQIQGLVSVRYSELADVERVNSGQDNKQQLFLKDLRQEGCGSRFIFFTIGALPLKMLFVMQAARSRQEEPTPV